MLLLSEIILCILVNLFLKPMLLAFGATNQIFDYALNIPRLHRLEYHKY